MPRHIRDGVVFFGQSEGTTFHDTPAGFPGGWVADANLQIGRTASVWSQYDPGTTSAPSVGGPWWGPEAEFARRWRLDSPNPLFIIKRCPGATGLVTPNPVTGRSWNCHETDGEFSLLCDDVKAATDFLAQPTLNITLDIKALVWIGNETDSLIQADANRVRRELEDLFEGARLAFGCPRAKGIIGICKNVPFKIGMPTVRAAQQHVASLPGNISVDEDPLTFDAGGHIITPDVVTFGGQLYDAYKTVAAL